MRLDRLTATAEGASWSLTEPARIVYAGDRVDVDRLALASGPQKIEAAGAVAIGDATARAVPADRPLRLTLTDVDLAAVDRLAKTGRDLGGIVNGTATASGDLLAPDGDRARSRSATARSATSPTSRSTPRSVTTPRRRASRPGSSAAPSG